MQSVKLTFVVFGYFPSTQVLSNGPGQNILGYEQRTYEQRKAVLGKRENWVPYPTFNTILRLPLLRTRNIWVNSNPRARENSDSAAPNNIPYSSTPSEIGA